MDSRVKSIESSISVMVTTQQKTEKVSRRNVISCDKEKGPSEILADFTLYRSKGDAEPFVH